MYLQNNIFDGPLLFVVPIDGSMSINLDKIIIDGGRRLARIVVSQEMLPRECARKRRPSTPLFSPLATG